MKRILTATLFFLSTLQVFAEGNEYMSVKFELIRTFHAPIILTVHNYPQGNQVIKAEVYSGKGGYEWGESETKIKKISEKEMNRAFELFDSIEFASVFKDYPMAGLDGSTWKFEAKRFGSSVGYSFWSPRNEKGTEGMVELARYLLDLAEIQIDDQLLY